MFKNKTVVVFSPTPSHPQNAGNRSRIFTVTKKLQDLGYRVHFVYFSQEGLFSSQESMMRECWDDLTIIHKVGHYKMTGSGYYKADDWYQDGIGEVVSEICEKERPVAVLVNYIFQSKLLEFIDDEIVKIIDSIDLFTDRHLMLKASGIEPDYFYTVSSEEQICFNRADYILAIQEHEAEIIRSMTSASVLVLPHVILSGVKDLKFLGERRRKEIVLGFIGSANSLNVTSLKEFLNVLALVNEELGDIYRLKVGGSVCEKLSKELEELRFVEAVGYIDDLRDFFFDVDIAVNPLVAGTGLKIKTVDSLLNGIPVISTVSGFDGFESDNPFHCLTSPAEFEQPLLQLAKSKALIEVLKSDSEKAMVSYLSLLNAGIERLELALLSKSRISSECEAQVIPSAVNSDGRLDLLIVSHIDFWRSDLGNRVRLMSFFKYLRRYCSVKIFYCGKKSAEDIETIARLGFSSDVVFSVDVDVSFLNKTDELLVQSVIDDSRLKPVRHMISSDWVKSLLAYSRGKSIGVTIAEYIQFSWVALLRIADRCVLDTHDVMFIRQIRFEAARSKHHIEITEDQEVVLYNLFDAVMAIQVEEFRYMKGVHRNPFCVPVSFDVSPPKINPDMLRLGFVGGGQDPNVDGLRWFLINVLPMLEGLELVVFGDVGKFFTSYDNPSVKFYGRVESLDDVYSGMDVVINPVRFGGGLKIKTVEALSYGLPLVSTTEGVCGMPSSSEAIYMEANTVDEWLFSILAMKRSHKLRSALSSNALDYMRGEFSDAACYSEIKNYLLGGRVD